MHSGRSFIMRDYYHTQTNSMVSTDDQGALKKLKNNI